MRRFGLVAVVLFGTLLSIGLWKEKLIPIVLFGTLTTLGAGFILLPGPHDREPAEVAGWLQAEGFEPTWELA